MTQKQALKDILSNYISGVLCDITIEYMMSINIKKIREEVHRHGWSTSHAVDNDILYTISSDQKFTHFRTTSIKQKSESKYINNYCSLVKDVIKYELYNIKNDILYGIYYKSHTILLVIYELKTYKWCIFEIASGTQHDKQLDHCIISLELNKNILKVISICNLENYVIKCTENTTFTNYELEYEQIDKKYTPHYMIWNDKDITVDEITLLKNGICVSKTHVLFDVKYIQYKVWPINIFCTHINKEFVTYIENRSIFLGAKNNHFYILEYTEGINIHIKIYDVNTKELLQENKIYVGNIDSIFLYNTDLFATYKVKNGDQYIELYYITIDFVDGQN